MPSGFGAVSAGDECESPTEPVARCASMCAYRVTVVLFAPPPESKPAMVRALGINMAT
jgi:hypothetical protein